MTMQHLDLSSGTFRDLEQIADLFEDFPRQEPSRKAEWRHRGRIMAAQKCQIEEQRIIRGFGLPAGVHGI
jgi:hypothetical protein